MDYWNGKRLQKISNPTSANSISVRQMLSKENIVATVMVANVANVILNTSMERQLWSKISAMDNLKFQYVFLIK